MKHNKNILFSVIIPAFNEGKVIAECLKHIQNQEGDFGYEIIVVDNNSDDNTGQIARDFGVRVIDEKKQGVGAARQKGTSIARGYYVMHIDADTHLPKNYFQEVLKRFKNNNKLVCVGGQIFFYDGKLWQNIVRFVVHWFAWFVLHIFWRGSIGPMGNNMTFKNHIYKKTDGFDRSLSIAEDANITRQLFRYGDIRFDMSLKCYVSSRRLTLSWKCVAYCISIVSMWFRGTPFINHLSQHDL